MMSSRKTRLNRMLKCVELKVDKPSRQWYDCYFTLISSRVPLSIFLRTYFSQRSYIYLCFTTQQRSCLFLGIPKCVGCEFDQSLKLMLMYSQQARFILSKLGYIKPSLLYKCVLLSMFITGYTRVALSAERQCAGGRLVSSGSLRSAKLPPKRVRYSARLFCWFFKNDLLRRQPEQIFH